jgi:alanine racemase
MKQLDNIRDTRVEINIDTLRKNMQAIRSVVSSDTRISAVVKANAYGHGAIEAARILLESGADCLAVAIVEEAIELRIAGITASILILGHIRFQHATEVALYDLEPCVYRIEDAQAFSDEAVRQKNA